MTHSTLWLAQIQFFSGFGFMLMFLVLEFGLAWVLLFFRIMATRSAFDAGWMAAYRFWVRVFALAFILSFAAGMPVLIQFGSLWPELMEKAGNVAGPLLAAIILSMFVFKSCFLGAMLFGMRKLSDAVHTIMVAMVALGVTLSSFFLISLISWTHTPTGAALVDGHYVVSDAMQVVFNPALPVYGALFVAVSLLAVAFLMMAVVAGQAGRNPSGESYPAVFKTAMIVAVAGLVLHVAALGGTTRLAAQYHPAKAAAVAGYWQSGTPPDLVMAGWPDSQTASNRFDWTVKGKGASWLATDEQGQWRGLDQFSGMTPPLALMFWSFRIAVLTGVLMGAVLALLTWRLRRHQYDPALLTEGWRRTLRVMGALGGVTVLACVAYIQFGVFPYAVYETITLSEVMSSLSVPSMVFSNLLYGSCYVMLLVGFLYLLRYIARYGVIPVARRRGRA